MRVSFSIRSGMIAGLWEQIIRSIKKPASNSPVLYYSESESSVLKIVDKLHIEIRDIPYALPRLSGERCAAKINLIEMRNSATCIAVQFQAALAPACGFHGNKSVIGTFDPVQHKTRRR